MKYRLSALYALTMLVTITYGQEVSSCVPCEMLKDEHHLPDLFITSAEIEENDEATYCKVLGTIGKEINFELLLPERWNARYVMGGGGGFVGTVQNSARGTVAEGYATSGTDTGHKGRGAEWAMHSVERRVNFGHLAVHRTATVSKALIYRYYCQYPEYSYFMGCSRGGGQALIEAQRYPDDFDGIVSAAPVINWLATGLEFIQNIKALYPDPENLDAMISANHLQILEAEVLNQCDDIDGIADKILNDPRKCLFDFSALPHCVDGKTDSTCFNPAQIEAVKTIYAGVSNQGGFSYPGFPFGAEARQGGFGPWIVGPIDGPYPSLHFYFGVEMFKYIIYQDPEWDYSSYDFSKITKDGRDAAEYLNATSTDYSAFKERNGKLILYHGWNDPALSAYTAISHYEAAKKLDEDIADHFKLYLLPGVLHCGGGPGPDQAEWLNLIHGWVEEGKAPHKVIVTKRDQDGNVLMTRPVFPYPSVAKYDGSGDPAVESSFMEGKP